MNAPARTTTPNSVFAPPFASEPLAPSGGAIGPEPEDFRVDELPAYLPSGQGEHRYVRIEKRRLTTPEAVRVLARVADVDAREIGYAGLKDKHAVTTQWFSLPVRSVSPETWELPEQVRVLEVSTHSNKLRTGHLRGNRFAITLVGVGSEGRVCANAIAERVGRGIPNYFGAQRFGRGGENLDRALNWIRGGARARLNSFLLKLYPSVVQSEIFNRYVARRAEHGFDRLIAGEVVRLEGSGASFPVEDVERELPRLLRGDIHLTGPLPGPKMRPAAESAAALEEEVKASVELTADMERTLGKFAPGARRDVMLIPKDLKLVDDGVGRLRLEFELPAGSYATVVVREFTRSAWLDADAQTREEPT